MTRTCSIALCWSLASAVTMPKALAAEAALPAPAASPLPPASGARANVKSAGNDKLSTKAPHLSAGGRKSLPAYGYMKQASDDRDGLSRLQDQARQLRPPR